MVLLALLPILGCVSTAGLSAHGVCTIGDIEFDDNSSSATIPTGSALSLLFVFINLEDTELMPMPDAERVRCPGHQCVLSRSPSLLYS